MVKKIFLIVPTIEGTKIRCLKCYKLFNFRQKCHLKSHELSKRHIFHNIPPVPSQVEPNEQIPEEMNFMQEDMTSFFDKIMSIIEENKHFMSEDFLNKLKSGGCRNLLIIISLFHNLYKEKNLEQSLDESFNKKNDHLVSFLSSPKLKASFLIVIKNTTGTMDQASLKKLQKMVKNYYIFCEKNNYSINSYSELFRGSLYQ